jgi:capsular exopolysaccharide synthesis family protein
MYATNFETRLRTREAIEDLPVLGGGENFIKGSDGTSPSRMALISAVSRHGWKIIGVALLTVIAVFILSKNINPMYQATATLEINPERPSELLGPEAVRTAWNDADQYIATQLRVIQEDSVLRPVVQEFKLPPNPEKDANAPIVLKGLEITRPPNTYLIQISYRSHDRVVAASVANAIAQSYLHHVFQKKLDDRQNQTSFMENQLDGLRESMERSTQAVNEFERKLGVVDPQEKTNIVSARLMQLNTEYTTAQADRIKREADYVGLKGGSLPAAQQSEQGEALKRLQTQLYEAEQKFTEIREHYGVKHPEYEKQQAIIANLQLQLDQAKDNVAARGLVAYQDAQHREATLRQELAEAKAAFDDLNAKSYRYQALRIEAENNRKLYDDVEQRIKEAGINGTFESGMTHVSDNARPPLEPIYPRIKLNLFLGLGFALIGGVLVALTVELSNDKIRGIDDVQSYFHVDVLGVIPQIVSKPKLLSAPIEARSNIQTTSEVAPTPGGEVAISPSPLYVLPNEKMTRIRLRQYEESLRMLWSSFQLSSEDNSIKSMMITSAMPEEGKTTITMQIAAIHAMHGRKTLVIDADLRRPGAHRLANVVLTPGLGDVVQSKEDWQDYVVPSAGHPNLYILPAGTASARSCDEIVRLLPRLFAEAERDYDLILVDAPPLLSFSESLHIASSVDGVMVVVCADRTRRHSLGTVLNTLKRLRANTIGVAINKIEVNQQPDSYKYLQYYGNVEAV